MSKQRCQQETTATEFYRWMVIFKEEDERVDAITCREQIQDMYLAQIAMYIAKTHTKNPERVKLESFLFHGKKKPHKQFTQAEKEQQITIAKAYWRRFLSSCSVKRAPKKRAKHV